MRRKVFLTAAVAAVGLMLGLSVYSLLANDHGKPVRLVSRGWEKDDTWPASRSWVWSINPVATKNQVGVCIRTTERPLAPGEAPSNPVIPELPARGTERHTGWTGPGDLKLEGRLTCQLIDFGEAGLAEAVGRQPLRMLIRFRVGGSLSVLGGPSTVLPGDRLAGITEVEPRWVNDELHLLTFYTRTEDTYYTHHVIVQQRNFK